MQVHEDGVRVPEGGEDGILDARVDPAPADGGHGRRGGAEPVVRDRHVVRGEVPGGVHVDPDGAEVRAHHRHVVDAPEVARIEELLHALDAGVVHEDVPDHEDPVHARGEGAELLGLRRIGCDRLLDEHVLAGLERALHQCVVRARRRRDHHGVDPAVGHHGVGRGVEADVGEPRPDLVEPSRVGVDHPDDLARPVVVKVADEVRPPLPGTDDGDADHRRSRRPA